MKFISIVGLVLVIFEAFSCNANTQDTQSYVIQEYIKKLGADYPQDWREDAKVQLIKIGISAIPETVKALNNDDALIRAGAAYVLGEIGEKNELEFLMTASNDRDLSVRQAANEAIQKIMMAKGRTENKKERAFNKGWSDEDLLKDFCGFSAGYHYSSLVSFNDFIRTETEFGSRWSANVFNGSSFDISADFGFKFDELNVVKGSPGIFTPVSTKIFSYKTEVGYISIWGAYLKVDYKRYLCGSNKLLSGTLTPYVNGGAGWYWAFMRFYDPTSVWVRDGVAVGSSPEGSGNALGFHGGGGLEYCINQNTYIGLSVNYLYAVIREIYTRSFSSTKSQLYLQGSPMEIDFSGVDASFHFSYYF